MLRLVKVGWIKRSVSTFVSTMVDTLRLIHPTLVDHGGYASLNPPYVSRLLKFTIHYPLSIIHYPLFY